jgi:hypothetical protein
VPDPDEEFNRIVEGLDLELPFPHETEAETDGRHPSDPQFQPEPKRRAPAEHEDDEIAYRTPPPRPRRPPSRARTSAWVAVLGGPMLLVVATLFGILLPRPVVFAAALIFVAAVIYLISQLPEHGPSRPDWPDDGAVL